MSEQHVSAQLNAYYDGELEGRQLHRVEAHLARCAACRVELAELKALSTLLQQSTPAETLTTPERFVAQVGLQLPRRPEKTTGQKILETGWRLAPAALFGAWAFVQVAFLIGSGLLMVRSLGLVPEALATLWPNAQEVTWFNALWNTIFASLPEVPQTLLRALSQGWALRYNILTPSVVWIGIGLLYSSWLATWWLLQHRHHQSLNS